MEHFVCTGTCGGVSDTPGTCQAEGCSRHEKDLQACSCADGAHAGAKQEEGQEHEGREGQ